MWVVEVVVIVPTVMALTPMLLAPLVVVAFPATVIAVVPVVLVMTPVTMRDTVRGMMRRANDGDRVRVHHHRGVIDHGRMMDHGSVINLRVR